MAQNQDNGKIFCYRSGPIERYPADSFQKHNILDEAFAELGVTIIGDTFEILKSRGTSQEEYGLKLKQLRNQGKFYEYGKKELLLVPSLRSVRHATFMVVKPSREASGGTTSETVQARLHGIPMLVIIGAHGENLCANDSTFMIRMLTDRFALVFDTEKEVIDFVRKHIAVFRSGSRALRHLMVAMKRIHPYTNDRPRPLYDACFNGKTVIILGMPGAGKSDQTRMLQDRAGFAYFGSGHELRRLGTRIPALQKSLAKGNLAPEMLINKLLADHILRLEPFEPIVFDGAPKKLGEATLLVEFLKYVERAPEVIVLDIPEEAARMRMMLRRNCSACEKSFANESVKASGICPLCGGAVSGRPENESRAAIEEIFSWYHAHVEAVIRFFEERGVVTHINGERDKEEVFQNILSALRK